MEGYEIGEGEAGGGEGVDSASENTLSDIRVWWVELVPRTLHANGLGRCN